MFNTWAQLVELVHCVERGAQGRVASADATAPTVQDPAIGERDLRRAAGTMLVSEPDRSEARLKLGLEMVTRAHDPCISCSVHVAGS